MARGAVVVGCLALFAVPLKMPFNVYDEGIALFNAARVAEGEVPIRDYWTIYPPGQSYVLAGAFRLFGTDALTGRAVDTLFRMAIALCVLALAARLTSRAAALALFAVASLLLATPTYFGYSVFPALLFALLGVLASMRYLDGGRDRWLFGAGVAVGLAAAFRLDLGAYAGLAVALGLALFELGGDPGREGTAAAPAEAARAGRGRRLKDLSSRLLLLGAGIALVVLPFYGWLAAAAGIGELWNDLVVFPSTVYHRARHVLHPPLLPPPAPLPADARTVLAGMGRYEAWLLFYLPPAVFATAAVAAWASIRRSARGAAGTARNGESAGIGSVAAALSLAGLGTGLYLLAVGRHDHAHVLPTSLPALIVAVWLLRRLPPRFRRRRALAIPAAAAAVLLLWPYVVPPAQRLIRRAERFPPTGCYSALERAGCVSVAADQEAAIRYVRERTGEDEPIFSGNRRHDRIWVNDVGLYFLADRPSATRYHELHPGLADTLAVQRAIAAELTAPRVRWIVTREWPASEEPNASSVSTGVHHLDKSIEARYEPVERFGPYRIWRRRR